MPEDPKINPQRKGLPASLFISLLFLGVNLYPVLAIGVLANPRNAILVGIAWSFSTLIMFLILFTGKISRWRKIYFSVFAIAFFVHSIWWATSDRGHLEALDQQILYPSIPMCRIAIPSILAPLIVNREIVFPGNFDLAAGTLLIFILVTLVFGRTFCSWVCLMGGQDELFSSLRQKPLWKITVLPPFLRYFAFAFLLLILLDSLATLSPAYCIWFCPYKVGGDYAEFNSSLRVVQGVIFVGLWAGLILVLPLLTKKRIQCGLFCPMGALLSLTKPITIFKLTIDRKKCNQCQRCISRCPTFSITPESLAQGKTTITCTLCGACVEGCPTGAVSFGMKGVPFTASNHPLREGRTKVGAFRRFVADVWEPGVIFLFGIYWLANYYAVPIVVDVISRLLKYFLGA